MILDEATSSVDVESEREIRECLKNLSGKRTLIMISHRLSSIRNADSIYILENGTIEESGTHEELMKNDGLYRRLVEEQRILEEGL